MDRLSVQNFFGIHSRDTSGKLLSLLRNLLSDYKPLDCAIRLWDGASLEPDVPRRFTFIVRRPETLWKIFWNPGDLTLGEAYIYNDIDVEGDLKAAFRLAEYLMTHSFGTVDKLKMAWYLLGSSLSTMFKKKQSSAPELTGARHSISRDSQAVSYHYDVSNDFYSLWLDKRMVYSCAYFENRDDDLTTAQEKKLDYICRKLRLKEGEKLLDIGCGWGAMIIHAAKHYGADAVGITLSRRQAEYANEQIRKEGVEDRCRVELVDYRQLQGLGRYDKIVSVGMFEHVGEERMREYFQQAWNLLRPGGIFLNHAISCKPEYAGRKTNTFSARYIFPDGELLPVSTPLNAGESVGFEIRDVECLREHYSLTLENWAQNLESNRERAIESSSEVTYRIWLIYLHACLYRFKRGVYNVYQSLLVKPDKGESGFPLTRSDLYRQ